MRLRLPSSSAATTASCFPLAVHPGGRIAATGSRDRSVRLWDVASGREVAKLERHFLDVTSLAFSPDGKWLASAGLDRLLLVWDVRAAPAIASAGDGAPDGSPSRALPTAPAREGSTRGGGVSALAYSGDGSRIALGLANNTIELWNTELWNTETFEGPGELAGHTGKVLALQFLPSDGSLVSTGADRTVRVWDLGTPGSRPKVLQGHSSPVLALAVEPSGAGWVTGAADIDEVPLPRAYATWLGRLLRFDLGRSFVDGQPVRDKIAAALPVTLTLNLMSILIFYLVSIPVGVLAAARRNGWFDHVSSLVLFVLYSMPSFWVATMLILLVGSDSGFTAKYFGFTLPFVGLHSAGAEDLPYLDYLADHYRHLILPLIAITYSSFAFMSRLVRSGMLEVLRQDFVRTARAKGLPEWKVVGVHAFRNSLIPVVTVFGNILPVLIGGSVIIEYIFTIPGMGQLAFQSILARDYPVIMAITTLSAVLTLLGILLADVMYAVVDPRIQLK